MPREFNFGALVWLSRFGLVGFGLVGSVRGWGLHDGYPAAKMVKLSRNQ